MSFKLLHFSDAHLGYKQYGLQARILDFAAALDRVADIAVEQKVNLVVDTGDTHDKPEPDPLSVGNHRRFVERLLAAGIPYLALIGNHNLHEVGRTMEGNPSWMEAVSDRIIRPRNPDHPHKIYRDPDRGVEHITVVAADWMPSDEIDAFLAKIPQPDGRPVDCLFMHQSMEGFMPVIARSEMKPAQIDGKCRYLGIGDVHVCRSFTTPLGTLVGSPGSTELNDIKEDRNKFVVLVTIPPLEGEIEWKPIPIKTRAVLEIPLIHEPHDLEVAKQKILETDATQPDPLVLLSYNRKIERQAIAMMRELQTSGFTRLKFTAETMVDETRTFTAVRAESSPIMSDVISEVLTQRGAPELIPVAQDLFNNSSNARIILDGLKEKIQLEVTAPPPPPPPTETTAA